METMHGKEAVGLEHSGIRQVVPNAVFILEYEALIQESLQRNAAVRLTGITFGYSTFLREHFLPVGIPGSPVTVRAVTREFLRAIPGGCRQRLPDLLPNKPGFFSLVRVCTASILPLNFHGCEDDRLSEYLEREIERFARR